VNRSQNLKYVDFRKSGMQPDQPWAIRGAREEVQRILKDVEGSMSRSSNIR
jgi:hypothetical protein